MTEEPKNPVVGLPDLSFLQRAAADDTSLESVAEFRKLSMVAMVQPTSPPDQKEAVGEGGLVLTPGAEPICRLGEAQLIVPLYFSKMYIGWADRNDPDAMIFERSADRNSRIAALCNDRSTWRQSYGLPSDERPNGRYTRMNTVHLEAYVCGLGGALDGQEFMISFSRTAYKVGSKWASAISMRKVRTVEGAFVPPMFTQVWALASLKQTRGNQTWYIPQLTTPDDIADHFVPANRLEEFKALHIGCKDAVLARNLGGDYDSAGNDAAGVTDDI